MTRSPFSSAYKKRRRPCLKCGRPFRSEGPWNRLCARCRRANAEMADVPTGPPRWNGELMAERGRPL